jgi:hypothetical protein
MKNHGLQFARPEADYVHTGAKSLVLGSSLFTCRWWVIFSKLAHAWGKLTIQEISQNIYWPAALRTEIKNDTRSSTLSKTKFSWCEEGGYSVIQRRYKPEGCGFFSDVQVFLYNFNLPAAIWPWGGLSLGQIWLPGISPWVKAAGAYGWLSCYPHVPTVYKFWEPLTPWALCACSGLYRHSCTFIALEKVVWRKGKTLSKQLLLKY